jgi:hypothetical protein
VHSDHAMFHGALSVRDSTARVPETSNPSSKCSEGKE